MEPNNSYTNPKQNLTISKNTSESLLNKAFDVNTLNFKNLGTTSRNKSDTNVLHIPYDNTTGIGSYSDLSKYSNNIKSDDNIKNKTHSNSFTEEENKTKLYNNATNKQISKEDPKTLKLIIKNLEEELKEKKDEIKILHKNFKDKISLIELENKKLIEQIDQRYKINLDELINNYETRLAEYEYQSTLMKTQYEELINKLYRDYNALKSSNISLSFHNEKINELDNNYRDKLEYLKKLYTQKLKDVYSYFDKPKYNQTLERIKFYNEHNVKFNNFEENLEFFKNNNFNLSEYSIWLDKIRLKIMEKDLDYIKEMSDIEINYEKLFENTIDDKFNKLEKLKEKINERFTLLEKISIFSDIDSKDEDYLSIHNQSGISRGINNIASNSMAQLGPMKGNSGKNIALMNTSNSVPIINNNRSVDVNSIDGFQFNSSILKSAVNNKNSVDSSRQVRFKHGKNCVFFNLKNLIHFKTLVWIILI